MVTFDWRSSLNDNTTSKIHCFYFNSIIVPWYHCDFDQESGESTVYNNRLFSAYLHHSIKCKYFSCCRCFNISRLGSVQKSWSIAKWKIEKSTVNGCVSDWIPIYHAKKICLLQKYCCKTRQLPLFSIIDVLTYTSCQCFPVFFNPNVVLSFLLETWWKNMRLSITDAGRVHHWRKKFTAQYKAFPVHKIKFGWQFYKPNGV